MKNKIVLKAYTALMQNNKILLTQDIDGDYGWKFPGGHVEEGELVKSAAIREVKEELGLDIVLDGVIGIEDYFKNNDTENHHQKYFFVSHTIFGEIHIKIDEVKEFRWLSKEEFFQLKEQDIYPAHRKAFKKFMDMDWNYYPIDLLME